ncbi:MAG: decaprenyl-phosphate phosphoribosyltransferase [Candidatus Brocadiia bacterium]
MSTEGVAAARGGQARALLAALRPHQWTKNLLVFAALIFAFKFLDPQSVLLAVAGFAVFCAASSASYLFNDVLDLERDRCHPVKSRRPVASGALAVRTALGASGLLAAAAVAGGFVVHWKFGVIVAGYLVLQVAYSTLLKHQVILDVMCISASFLARAYGGAHAIRVPISNWLLICAGLLSLFLALAKRRHELLQVQDAVNHRRSLAEYSPQMLDQMIAVVTASTVLAYMLYTIWPETVAKFGTDKLKYTIPFVLYGIFRYLYLVYSKDGGASPSRHLLTDRPILITVFLYAAASAAIIAATAPRREATPAEAERAPPPPALSEKGR